MDFFHETRLVSIAQVLVAFILEIHIQCGVPLCFCVGFKGHMNVWKQEFALALRKSNVRT